MKIFGDIKMSADQVIDTCIAVPKREDVVKHDTAINKIWKPISHSDAVETLMVAFEKHDIEVVESSFALNRTGHLLVGGFLVQGDCLPMVPKSIDGQYELFIRHANDMSVSLQLTVGCQLFVCTNGFMSGNQIARHKHVETFDMQQWAIDKAIPGFIEGCSGLYESVTTLQQTPVSDAQAHRLILESGLQGICPLARLTDIYRQWHQPTFGKDDFEPYTAYKLYGDFTYVAQKCSPQRQLAIIEKAHDLIMSSQSQPLLLAA